MTLPDSVFAQTIPAGNGDERVSIYDLAEIAYDGGERADPDLVALGDRHHCCLNVIHEVRTMPIDDLVVFVDATIQHILTVAHQRAETAA